MVNLFVDCDDTLIIYDVEGPNPYGFYNNTPYIFNEPLLAGVKQFHIDNPHSLIVIWSGGGFDYAKMWCIRLGLYNDVLPLIKDKTTFELIKEDDIVIDDQELDGYRTHKPNEWP